MIRVWFKWLDLKRPLLAGFEAPDDTLMEKLAKRPEPERGIGANIVVLAKETSNIVRLRSRVEVRGHSGHHLTVELSCGPATPTRTNNRLYSRANGVGRAACGPAAAAIG